METQPQVSGLEAQLSHLNREQQAYHAADVAFAAHVADVRAHGDVIQRSGNATVLTSVGRSLLPGAAMGMVESEVGSLPTHMTAAGFVLLGGYALARGVLKRPKADAAWGREAQERTGLSYELYRQAYLSGGDVSMVLYGPKKGDEVPVNLGEEIKIAVSRARRHGIKEIAIPAGVVTELLPQYKIGTQDLPNWIVNMRNGPLLRGDEPRVYAESPKTWLEVLRGISGENDGYVQSLIAELAEVRSEHPLVRASSRSLLGRAKEAVNRRMSDVELRREPLRTIGGLGSVAKATETTNIGKPVPAGPKPLRQVPLQTPKPLVQGVLAVPQPSRRVGAANVSPQPAFREAAFAPIRHEKEHVPQHAVQQESRTASQPLHTKVDIRGIVMSNGQALRIAGGQAEGLVPIDRMVPVSGSTGEAQVIELELKILQALEAVQQRQAGAVEEAKPFTPLEGRQLMYTSYAGHGAKDRLHNLWSDRTVKGLAMVGTMGVIHLLADDVDVFVDNKYNAAHVQAEATVRDRLNQPNGQVDQSLVDYQLKQDQPILSHWKFVNDGERWVAERMGDMKPKPSSPATTQATPPNAVEWRIHALNTDPRYAKSLQGGYWTIATSSAIAADHGKVGWIDKPPQYVEAPISLPAGQPVTNAHLLAVERELPYSDIHFDNDLGKYIVAAPARWGKEPVAGNIDGHALTVQYKRDGTFVFVVPDEILASNAVSGHMEYWLQGGTKISHIVHADPSQTLEIVGDMKFDQLQIDRFWSARIPSYFDVGPEERLYLIERWVQQNVTYSLTPWNEQQKLAHETVSELLAWGIDSNTVECERAALLEALAFSGHPVQGIVGYSNGGNTDVITSRERHRWLGYNTGFFDGTPPSTDPEIAKYFDETGVTQQLPPLITPELQQRIHKNYTKQEQQSNLPGWLLEVQLLLTACVAGSGVVLQRRRITDAVQDIRAKYASRRLEQTSDYILHVAGQLVTSALYGRSNVPLERQVRAGDDYAHTSRGLARDTLLARLQPEDRTNRQMRRHITRAGRAADTIIDRRTSQLVVKTLKDVHLAAKRRHE
jgi:hypothetical protein